MNTSHDDSGDLVEADWISVDDIHDMPGVEVRHIDKHPHQNWCDVLGTKIKKCCGRPDCVAALKQATEAA